MLPAWPVKSECQARVVWSRSVGVATSSAMGAVIEPTKPCSGITDLGELVPGGLELHDELLKLLNLVGDHGALVAVHDRPQDEPDEQVFGTRNAEDGKSGNRRGQCKDECRGNDSFFHHDR